MNHVHHWLVETPQQGTDSIPARCKGCGEERTFPTVKSLATGYGGTMTDNRERQRKLYDGTVHRPYARASARYD